jgi:hypothetical protein
VRKAPAHLSRTAATPEAARCLVAVSDPKLNCLIAERQSAVYRISTMANSHDDEQGAAASVAMNRVLEAERAAAQDVAECERQAQTLLQAGYARAQRIAGRTDERISLLRMRNSEHVSRQIEIRERTELATRQNESDRHPPAERLTAVAETLAAELSGGEAVAAEGQVQP